MTPDAMAACHARAFAQTGRAWSVAEFGALLDNPLVISTGDRRAFALGRVVAREAELLTLACDPAHRRTGLARACLGAFETEARDRGAVTAFLEVAADNTAAIRLYHAADYTELARRRGYYPRKTEGAADAIVMRKTLRP